MSLRSALQTKAPELLHHIETAAGANPIAVLRKAMPRIYAHFGWEVPDIKNPVLMAKDLEARIEAHP